MTETDELFIARYIAGQKKSKDIVSFANIKLDSGVYQDEYLDIIDSELKVMTVLAPLFEKSVVSSGKVLPSIDQAVMQILEHHIALIASEKIDPYCQFQRLLSDIDSYDYLRKAKKYVGDSIGIHNMYGCYHSDDFSQKDINRALVKEAKSWVHKYGKEH